MYLRFPTAVVAAAALVLVVGSVARAETVDVALALAADVSRSIDDGEFQLQRQGYARAVTDPRVLDAIKAGVHGAVALCFIEWAGPGQQAVVAKWEVIRDGETAADFAAALLKMPRSFAGRTAIGDGIDFAVAQFVASGVDAPRKVIDVSGDGTNNAGRPVTEARNDAVKAGLTINGLAIINDRPVGFLYQHTQPPGGLPNYYRDSVIGGENAFLLVVQNFSTFADAMVNKLLTEIASAASPQRLARAQ